MPASTDKPPFLALVWIGLRCRGWIPQWARAVPGALGVFAQRFFQRFEVLFALGAVVLACVCLMAAASFLPWVGSFAYRGACAAMECQGYALAKVAAAGATPAQWDAAEAATGEGPIEAGKARDAWARAKRRGGGLYMGVERREKFAEAIRSWLGTAEASAQGDQEMRALREAAAWVQLVKSGKSPKDATEELIKAAAQGRVQGLGEASRASQAVLAALGSAQIVRADAAAINTAMAPWRLWRAPAPQRLDAAELGDEAWPFMGLLGALALLGLGVAAWLAHAAWTGLADRVERERGELTVEWEARQIARAAGPRSRAPSGSGRRL